MLIVCLKQFVFQQFDEITHNMPAVATSMEGP